MKDKTREEMYCKRSPQAAMLLMAFVWTALVFLLVLLNFTITRILVILGSGGTGNRAILNMLVVVLFLAGSLFFVLNWDKTKVKLKDGALIVSKGSKKKVYRLGAISSVYTSQSRLGKIFNYGDIIINLTESDKNVTLKDIERPDSFLNALKNG